MICFGFNSYYSFIIITISPIIVALLFEGSNLTFISHHLLNENVLKNKYKYFNSKHTQISGRVN